MPYFRHENIALKGLAVAVPERKVEISEYGYVFGEDAVQKFIKSTGIHCVHRASQEQTASDLGVAAAQHLMKEKSIVPESVGIMLFVTQSPDYKRPSSASVVHHRLKLPIDCAVMEINLGCSGFVYGLQAICSMLNSSDAERGLLILGETASKLTNPKDKATEMLYGDAGAALLVQKDDAAPSIDISLKFDGNRFKSIILPAGGFRDMHASVETFMCSDGNERSLYDIHMDGTTVFSFTITDVPKTIQEYFEKTQSSPAQYDCFALHQANEFILKQLIRKFQLPKEKVPITLDRYGNTGGISIPLSLCDYYGSGQSTTAKIFLCGYGIGLSWGVASVKMNSSDIFTVIETSDFFVEGKITQEMLQQ
jgi:3-oxoacyl-[acyl-carrier-protein] synthase-3